MKKHSVLLRQLKRYQLNENECPKTLKQWQQFLDRINLAYISLDQDRYLLERSQEISEHEMQVLNKELKAAQTIVRLGSWTLDWESKKVQYSEEACRIFGFDVSKPIPGYEEIMQLLHPDDRVAIEKQIQALIEFGESYENEIRIYPDAGSERWLKVAGKPVYGNGDGKVQKLTGTMLDITDQKQAQAREMELSRQLVIAARQAGMAEIATSVLHNVGNVLNSVNVSATLISERLDNSKMENLKKIAELFEAHKENLTDFLLNDPRGQQVFSYFGKLTRYWEEERAWLLKELGLLTNNVDHIKSIVRMQQSVSGTVGLIEPHVPADILEEALQIDMGTMEKAKIQVVRDYQSRDSIMLDRSRLHQILVNLIHNAKDALMDPNVLQCEKKMVLRVLDQKNSILIQIIDNGIGISPEKLLSIFSFGFTTKKTGHGFGLHSSALAAKEMGGCLTVQSQGLNKGAVFNLELPKKNSQEVGEIIDEQR